MNEVTSSWDVPDVNCIARQLRKIHKSFCKDSEGGEFVSIGRLDGETWEVSSASQFSGLGVAHYGREFVPDNKREDFDAMASARRMVFAAQEAGWRYELADL